MHKTHKTMTFDADTVTALINQVGDALAARGVPCSHETAYAMLVLSADAFQCVPREVFVTLAGFTWDMMSGAPAPKTPPTAARN